jgi:hypothetical protein
MPGDWSALQTSAEINHGNSGGPAFNDHGEVIGLATFGSSDPGVRGINFLVPISIAKEFLQILHVTPKQGPVSELYQEGLEDMRKSCYKRSLSKFGRIEQINPRFPFLQERVQEANHAIDDGLDHCWVPNGSTGLYAGSAAALLGLLAASWFFAKTRFRTNQTTHPAGAPFAAAATKVARDSTISAGSATAVLEGRDGALAGRRFFIDESGLRIGRDPAKCQIVLQDDKVSKEHALITRDAQGVILTDLGSSNGTYVNSVNTQRVTTMRLQPGDCIYIGKSIASFRYLRS